MSEPDIFYILGNKVRRDLLSHLTCTECYFSLLSNKVSVSSTAVSKHLKIMEREGLLKSYEKEGKFIGPVRKYYKITLSNTYVVTVTPNLFWYKGIKLEEKPSLRKFEINLENLDASPDTLQSMVINFIDANKELGNLLEALKTLESYRDMLVRSIKERYLDEIGDMTQLAILHYLLLYGEATIEDLSDRLNLKEREVIKKAEELNKFVPLIIKEDSIKIDEEKLRKIVK
ncbi:sulfur metabolism transcriptional regulator SurR [Thermococcus paralvinellae]|uniref:Transcriptional regulator, ArsR family n=1 Tax=Thermococcus paralvinellae TaxID=582419 RepID=W0I1W4_9EURY|nr:ArsR family transcriptional regulator [Thermococcus paralvinellae]AHF79999.1 Transcriptional regulator, ArsR family [Thermococcus paralvinellae]